MPKSVALAVVGAGLIGKRHAEAVLECGETFLDCLVDPAPVGRALAAEFGVPCLPDLQAMLDRREPGGVIIATPNQMHVEHGLICVDAGVHALLEKPIAAAPCNAGSLFRRFGELPLV